GRGPRHRPRDPYGPSEGLPDRVLPRLFRDRRFAGAVPPELFPVHRALRRGRYRLLAPGRRVEDWPRWRLAGNPRQRHGASAGIAQLRHRPGRISGFCLRDGDRAGRDAEIRHPRSAHDVRFGSALAQALRVSAARHPLTGARPAIRKRGMKTTLSWLKTHLATSAPLGTLVERLVMLGHDVEGIADRAA